MNINCTDSFPSVAASLDFSGAQTIRESLSDLYLFEHKEIFPWWIHTLESNVKWEPLALACLSPLQSMHSVF